MGLPKRAAPIGGVPAHAADPSVLRDSFPALAAFMTETRWEDGSPREVGTLLFCAEDGRWKVWVNDKGNGVTAWLSAATWPDLLLALERGLAADSLEWRTPRPRKGSR